MDYSSVDFKMLRRRARRQINEDKALLQAFLARQRPRVQIPVGPLNTLCIYFISAASFQRNRCEGKICYNFPCISNPNWH